MLGGTFDEPESISYTAKDGGFRGFLTLFIVQSLYHRQCAKLEQSERHFTNCSRPCSPATREQGKLGNTVIMLISAINGEKSAHMIDGEEEVTQSAAAQKERWRWLDLCMTSWSTSSACGNIIARCTRSIGRPGNRSIFLSVELRGLNHSCFIFLQPIRVLLYTRTCKEY